jgi:hypothetical protein
VDLKHQGWGGLTAVPVEKNIEQIKLIREFYVRCHAPEKVAALDWLITKARVEDQKERLAKPQ